jgi:DNA-binding MarR family transcriptional regulator
MAGPNWTFLTNHARVLFSLAAQPDLRLREVAEEIGITERAVQRIVTDLEAAGILTRSREGRRNRYEINPAERLRHPNEAHRTVGDLLALGQVLGTMAEGER